MKLTFKQFLLEAKQTRIEYAVRCRSTGEYYTEKAGPGTLKNAKTWRTRGGAARTADDWGSMVRPRKKNDVVEVEVTTTPEVRKVRAG